MPDKKQQTVKGEVKPKGYWQSPQQTYQARRTTWARLEREKFDYEKFKNMKFVTYFNNEPIIETRTEYDRMFHHEDDLDPKIKKQNLREKIFEEEKRRAFPVVTSHLYGHRTTDLEGKAWLCHKRLAVISEMYRRNYVNMKPDKKLPAIAGIQQL